MPPGADWARKRLQSVLRRLDGSRELAVALAESKTLPIIVRAWSRSLTPHDTVVLERLRRDLDALPPPRSVD